MMSHVLQSYENGRADMLEQIVLQCSQHLLHKGGTITVEEIWNILDYQRTTLTCQSQTLRNLLPTPRYAKENAANPLNGCELSNVSFGGCVNGNDTVSHL